MLHALQELADSDGVVVNHHDIGIHGLNVLVNLVEPKSLLLGLFVCGGIVGDSALRILAETCVRGMALESEVECLDGGAHGGKLLHKVETNLGVSSGLVNMGADE
jgi:hypothetical protein